MGRTGNPEQNAGDMAMRLKEAQERAERAEREVADLRGTLRDRERQSAGQEEDPQSGLEALRKDAMMAHLLKSLEAGKDIGHYGRLVFAMVAHHFLPEDELLRWLTKDGDFDENAARVLLRQVEGRDYNPPRRERIQEWQRQQEFPILPNADDPDCGNVYRTLKFPASVYEHIEEYQEEKVGAEMDRDTSVPPPERI